MSERRPLQGANNQTKGQRQEKAGRRSDLSTTSCDDLVLGPKGDRCQWMFVTVAGDVDVETRSPQTRRKESRECGAVTKDQPRVSRKVNSSKVGQADRQTDR